MLHSCTVMYFYPLLSLVYAEADNAYNIQVLSFTNNVFDCVFCYIIESYVSMSSLYIISHVLINHMRTIP